ncbi:iron-containing alcohol dehydrogenase family protein [Marinilactibacillus kalidii]|uniref:iron-containing alcohol dehydrogenase family protein n=1 Tax=Marinilactibacillus kalidii TaxID=2820274 RepID=UPI001ABDC2EC|nr:iron-containing alcohol dehydrogenase family protein [Marinilactibacillus kalidii]
MSLIVRTGPQEYECRTGVLETLTHRVHQYKKVVLIHGTTSWDSAKPYLKGLIESDVEYQLSPFNGECTYAEVDRIVALAEESKADVIIGVGGGKLCDAVKYAAVKVAGLQSILVPTLASNCAPWTPLSVMYDEEGICLGFDIHNEQVGMLLIEPALIMNSPVNYFIAGIADTLAKWYESDVILSQPAHQTNAFLQMARAAAQQCRDDIVQHGLQAVSDMRAQTLTPVFTQIIETIIAISGLVGGLGDSYARTTIGHAVHDKITIFPESHAFLHGEKVAYGVMVQLAFEDNWSEIDKLSNVYDELALPKSLKDLELGQLSEKQIKAFADEIVQDEILVSTGYPVTHESLYQSMIALEVYMKST